MDKIEFVQGWDHAFLGAMPFKSGDKPFYAYIEEFCVIVHAYGACLYSINDAGEAVEYSSNADLTFTQAVELVESIESNPKGFIEFAKLLFNRVEY